MKRTVNASRGKDPSRDDSGWNSERDCQRLFKRLGYTLSIPVQSLQHTCDVPHHREVTTYHIRPEDWLHFWFENHPEIVGGCSANLEDNCSAFWQLYQHTHESHLVFQRHSGRLSRVLPILIHGDEGRAVKKTNYLIVSIESPLGSLPDQRVSEPCFL